MYNLNNNDLFAVKTDKSSSNTTQTNEAYAEKIINLAHCFFSYLKRGKKIDAKFARTSITNIFGGTDADGVWNWKDIYEAQEVACILTIRHYTASLMRKSFEDRLESVNKLQTYCLTHTKRSETSVKFNQFSTPLPYALFAVECANLTSNDVVLEPSAGTGIIASLAQMHGAEVVVNEYEPKRFAITKELFKNAYNLDGRYIRDTLDINIKPTAIIMNPPFNIDDPATARSHLKGAFDCLENGGRLVAITSKENDISKTVLKASVSGQAFYKHGTSVDTFIHVRDKGTQTADHEKSLETRFEFKDAIDLLPNARFR